MATKKISNTRNAKTGSYTVRVHKSAATGKFVSESKRSGRMQLSGQPKKQS